MKEIKLMGLTVKNFMGVKEAEIEPKGKNILVIGENEAGKTRFATAWNWLLFGKDVDGNSEFDIKWLDENNKIKEHGLDYVVEGKLSVDGDEVTLKKIFYEKFQKKKGSNIERFTGHSTDYFFNEVPMKKKEYDAKIHAIIDEETFRLLTDPDYFCGKMHWKDRRSFLMDTFVGDVTDQEVIEENNELFDLQDVVEKRSVDDHKEVCKSKKKEINKQIKKIPTRIDEASNNLPDISDYDESAIKDKIKSLKKEKKDKEKELSQAESGGAVAKKEKRLAEVKTEMQELKNEHSAGIQDELQEKRSKFNELCNGIDSNEREIKKRENDIKAAKSKIEQHKSEQDKLRNKWNELQEEKKQLLNENWTGDLECPTCGQELPEEQIEEKKQEYNKDKAERLEKITKDQKETNQKGISLGEEIDKLKSEIEQLEQKIEKLTQEKSELEEKSEALEEEMKELQNEAADYKKSMKYKKLQSEKKSIEKAIQNLKEDNAAENKLIQDEIDKIENKIDAEKDKLKDIESYEKGQERIEELKSEEEKLAEKFEEMERQINLCEKFTKAKVDLLEEDLNDHFDYTDWKLFEQLINGGIEKTCEALHEGVSYNSTLNTGSKLLVGIDVINTLSEHYGVRVPVFVDNFESVTKEIDSESQLIKLKAVPGVKKLQVKEADHAEEKEQQAVV